MCPSPQFPALKPAPREQDTSVQSQCLFQHLEITLGSVKQTAGESPANRPDSLPHQLNTQRMCQGRRPSSAPGHHTTHQQPLQSPVPIKHETKACRQQNKASGRWQTSFWCGVCGMQFFRMQVKMLKWQKIIFV